MCKHWQCSGQLMDSWLYIIIIIFGYIPHDDWKDTLWLLGYMLYITPNICNRWCWYYVDTCLYFHCQYIMLLCKHHWPSEASLKMLLPSLKHLREACQMQASMLDCIYHSRSFHIHILSNDRIYIYECMCPHSEMQKCIQEMVSHFWRVFVI